MSDEEQTIEELLASRESVHGPYVIGATLAFKLKQAVREGRVVGDARPMSITQAEAIEAILNKISRIVVGNAQEPDHWRDIAGYALLGKKGCPK